ncbi:hypothetical protein ACFCT7_07895 [Fulvivirgaceae bacterium LMO-SS25]
MKPLPRFGMVYLAFVGLACLAAFVLQPIPNFEELPLADYHHYLAAFDYFAGNVDAFEVRYPYNQRILISWLAAQLPVANPIHAFLLINLVFTMIGAYFWLKIWGFLKFSQLQIIALLLFFSLHFAGWLRLHVFDPVSTDPAQMAIYSIGIYLMLYRKYAYILSFALLALPIKESTLVLILAFLLLAIWLGESKKNITLIAVAVLLTFIELIVINAQFSGLGTPSKGAIYSIYNNLSLLLNDPQLLLRWIAAFFVVFGGIPALVFSARRYWEWDTADKILVITGLSILALSLIGGQDYTRLIMFSAPVLFTFGIKNVDKEKWVWMLSLLVSLPFLHLIGHIYDPLKKREEFEALFPEYGVIEGVWSYLIYGVIVNLTLAVIFHFLSRKSR